MDQGVRLLQQRIPLDPTIHENFSSSRYPNSLCPLSDERERLTARKNIALVSGGKKEAEATLNASGASAAMTVWLHPPLPRVR